jgi:hypothetical protein
MRNRSITRVTLDIPTVDHKKLKMLAAFYSKSMREVFVELLERGLEKYEEECPFSHEPNATTKKAIENVKKRRGLKKAASVEDLFL